MQKKETLNLAESADSSNSNEDILVTSIRTGSPIPDKEQLAFDTKQVTSINTGNPKPNKELVASTKRKRSQETISPNTDQKKEDKHECITTRTPTTKEQSTTG